MQQRHPTKDGEYGPRGVPQQLDYFPTPPWATRAGCLFLDNEMGERVHEQTVWEPCCGEGFMSRPLAERFGKCIASDVHRYDDSHILYDFTLGDDPSFGEVDWCYFNPPFNAAADFVRLGLKRSRRGVVAFVRSSFTEGEERLREIFAPMPPAYVVTYTERVVLLRDRLIQANRLDPFAVNKDGELEPKRASSATSYALIVWRHGDTDTRHRWIPPSRQFLERDGDYPAYEEQWAKVHAAQAGERKLLI